MAKRNQEPDELDKAILGIRQHRARTGGRRGSAVPIGDQVRAVVSSTSEAYETLKKTYDDAVAEGRMVVLLDPSLIDETDLRDRDDSSFGDEAFARLQADIAANGQVTPVALRKSIVDASRHEVIFGHRRVRACRALGKQVRAIILKADNHHLLHLMLVENAIREDISPLEKARHYRKILDEGIVDRQGLADLLRVSPQQVSNISVLADIPVECLEMLGDWRKLSIGTGKSLLSSLRNANFRIPNALRERALNTSGDANRRAQTLIHGLAEPLKKALETDNNFLIKDQRGRRYGLLTRSGKQWIIRFQPGLDEDTIRRIATKVPELYDDMSDGRDTGEV